MFSLNSIPILCLNTSSLPTEFSNAPTLLYGHVGALPEVAKGVFRMQNWDHRTCYLCISKARARRCAESGLIKDSAGDRDGIQSCHNI